MPSPVAHALAGAALYAGLTPRGAVRADWRPWGVAALAGATADLDFLPGLLVGDPSRYHHWATHSLLAALVFALLVAPLGGPLLGQPRRGPAILAAAYLSPLALDWVTVDRTVPRGIPLLWPASDAVFLAPVQVFADIHHGASWEAFVNWHNATAVLTEAVVLGGPLAVLCARRLRRPLAATGVAS